MRAIGVAEDRKRAALADDFFPTSSDLVERFVPGDWAELSTALWPEAFQWSLQALRRVNQVHVPANLSAGEARGEGVIGIARDVDDPAILDLHNQGTHV